MATVARGTDLKGLNSAVSEYFNPGDRLTLILGLPDDITDEQAQAVAREMRHKGLPVEGMSIGSTPEWANALEVTFRRPARPRGVAIIPMLPVAAWVIAAIGAAGIGGILGWRLGNVVEKVGQNLVPLALIAGGIFILHAMATRKAA